MRCTFDVYDMLEALISTVGGRYRVEFVRLALVWSIDAVFEKVPEVNEHIEEINPRQDVIDRARLVLRRHGYDMVRLEEEDAADKY